MYRDFDISLLVPGMKCDPTSLETHSLGGSESAGLYMAFALAQAGAHVVMFCNTDSATEEAGVHFEPISRWGDYVRDTPHDVCVVQRTPEVFAQATRARLNVLWCHDLALGRQERAFKSASWNIDRVIVLSRFMKEQYQRTFGLPDEVFFGSRNGVDVARFERLMSEGIARDSRSVIYGARPERGLDILLTEIFPRLLTEIPDLRLHLTTYDNRVAEWSHLYERYYALAASFGDKIVRLRPLSKPDLYRHYLGSRLYLYPTPSPALPGFREVSCISAMECQAAGLPIVCSAAGALPETIAFGAGSLIEGDPVAIGDRAGYVDRFCSQALRLLRDDQAWEAAHRAGLDHARTLSWQAVAGEWIEHFESAIRFRNADRRRLHLHLKRTSDLYVAELVRDQDAAKTSTGDVRDETGATSGALDSVAPPSSARDEDRPSSVELAAENDLRLGYTSTWLGTHCTGASRVVIVGPTASDFARRLSGLSDQYAFSAADVATARTLSGTMGRQLFDAAVIHGALETTAEPWAMLTLAESMVKPRGPVLFSSPYGAPASSPLTTSPQCWSLDAHDIRHKAGLDSFVPDRHPCEPARSRCGLVVRHLLSRSSRGGKDRYRAPPLASASSSDDVRGGACWPLLGRDATLAASIDSAGRG